MATVSSNLLQSRLATLLSGQSPASGGASALQASYNATMQQRYAQVQGKTADELAAMGITLGSDGTYFLNGQAWLTKNNIDQVTGKYAALYDANGNYAYPLTIPQDLMAAVVAKYSSTLSKDEMIALAQKAYSSLGSGYNNSDATIQQGITNATAQTDPTTAAKIQQADSTQGTTTAAPSFVKKYAGWILIGVGGILLIVLLMTKKKK